MKNKEKTLELAGKKLTLSTGGFAQQATGAVMATYGETVVMATVVAAPMRQDPGYFPLHVEYEEKLYAGGRIKGSRWVKRKGRPVDDEILVARLIDRGIRPLFPAEYEGMEVQVIANVLSIDKENPADMPAAVAVSAALAISAIPWNGPLGTVRVGRVDGKLTINPVHEQMEKSDLDLIVSSTKESVVMIEAGADQVVEKDMAEAIEFANKEAKKLVKFVTSFAKEVGTPKEKLEKVKIPTKIATKIKKLAGDSVADMTKKLATKEAGYSDIDAMRDSIVEQFEEEEKADAKKAFEELNHDYLRKMLLTGKRPDGRKTDELRELSAEVGILPRTHGTGLFQRGQTQALSIATLGSKSVSQLIETAEGESTKTYMHHYAMPPYSVGETGRLFPSRREIGHGALAEKAMMPVIPSQEDFPYTTRVVTEILSGNGSTSMASVCGSTLSLMDAGVPIKAPVAGIAMGVVIETTKKYKVLTDIVGIEDGGGDMDFKVAGTKDGITALQLDVKSLLLTPEILKAAMTQAKDARLQILKVMDGALKTPRKEVNKYAPKIKVVNIDPDKIGGLIGPGGKMIKGIAEETGAEIDVNDAGVVTITAPDEESLEAAFVKVDGVTRDVKPGEIYDGVVRRIENFGAFVEILPGKDGMVHISDMSTEYVKDPNDVVKIGQELQVRVKEIDQMKRINLSMILDPSKEPKKEPRRGNGGGSRGGSRSGGGYRGGNRGGGGGYNRNRSSQGGSRNYNRSGSRPSGTRSSGPSFPTSRLMDTGSSSNKR